MIGKGNLHPHGLKLAKYMTENGRVPVIDKRGFLADDLGQAFATIQAIAESQTRCENPFFHAYVRLPRGESLDAKQWLEVADRFEDRLGFSGQPRAVVLHQDEHGDRHMHAVWSRIDTETMRAIDPGLYKNKMKEVCRELEVEFALARVRSERHEDSQTLAAARSEFDHARRLGTDLTTIRETIRHCYDQSNSGAGFQAALMEHKLILARGDRRNFVVIDYAGGLHALGKRICGVTLAEVRRKMGTDSSRALPSVPEARAGRVAQQSADATGARLAPPNRSATKRQGQPPMHEASDGTPIDELLKWQVQREVERLAEVKALKEHLQAFELRKLREAEEAKRVEPARYGATAHPPAIEPEEDARRRYAEALGRHYDMRDPYGSLAQAALAEYLAFHKQRERLRREAGQQTDTKKKAEIELRMKIEACDYMAVTSERLAGISATIAGREDAPQAKADRERAKYWRTEAAKARQQRADQQRALSAPDPSEAMVRFRGARDSNKPPRSKSPSNPKRSPTKGQQR